MEKYYKIQSGRIIKVVFNNFAEEYYYLSPLGDWTLFPVLKNLFYNDFEDPKEITYEEVKIQIEKFKNKKYNFRYFKLNGNYIKCDFDNDIYFYLYENNIWIQHQILKGLINLDSGIEEIDKTIFEGRIKNDIHK